MNVLSTNFDMMIKKLSPSEGYERLLRCRDTTTGLEALISPHSTRFGPGAGGCRMWDFDSVEDAIYNVERSPRDMIYKKAAVNLPLSGGKSVIIGNARTQKTSELMCAFGRFAGTLQGSYYTAEDVGIQSADMEYAAEEPKYATGLVLDRFASGDPSPVTERGVFLCLKRAVEHKLGVRDLTGVRVALQGLGHVGMPLAEMLRAAGAVLIVTDTNEEVLKDAESRLDATPVGLGEIYNVEADVFAPCALGEILTPEVIDRLKVKVTAGSANNQLATPDCGALLCDKGIFYAPDYVVNGGGIVNAAMEILQIANPAYGETHIKGLVKTLEITLSWADKTGTPVNEVADAFAEEGLGNANV